MGQTLIVLLAIPLLGYTCWLVASVVVSAAGASRLVPARLPTGSRRSRAPVAILYMTCDDFDPDACATMLHQHGVETRLFILDDSTSEANRRRVDDWVASAGEGICVVRRRERRGFKAGNINNWLGKYGDPVVYPQVLLADADQRIPRDFVQRLLDRLEQEGAWFAQAGHDGTASTATSFQAAMYPQVECEWRYHVPARALMGVPLMLGHGVLIETRRLKEIGGFPPYMSEDLAVTIAFAELGGSGTLAPDVVGHEEFPPDYLSYWNRRRRWAKADAELLRAAVAGLVRAPIGLRARADFLTRQSRLPATSACWLLLVVLSVLSLDGSPQLPRWPSFAWGILLVMLVPILPALSFTHIPFLSRARFVVIATFVAASTISMYPPAIFQGIRGRQEFVPTGSWSGDLRPKRGNAVHTIWDLASGLLFCVSGFQSQTLSLMAVGIAVLVAPQLRRSPHASLMFLAAAAFWALLGAQVVADLGSGTADLEHLLPICGLAVTLL